MPLPNRPWFFGFLFLAFSPLFAQGDRPNIIFILTDDLGYGDLGRFYQNGRDSAHRFDTPRLDQLAETGLMLTDHYVSGPVCAPSRASFLLGLHQGHAPIRNNQFDKALPDGLNVASLLRRAGYRTIHVGKYGLAGKRGSALEGHPLRRGFSDFYGFLHHVDGHEHYPRNGTTEKKSIVVDGYQPITEGTEKTYTTDLFTARAKAYLIEQKRERPAQPLFMYLAYDTPHSKLQLPTGPYPAGYGREGGLVYTGADDPVTPHVNTARGEIDSYVHPDYRDRDWPQSEKVFATMVRRIDTAVGDLMQLLVDLDMDDNTIVVFSSDNGPHNVNGQDPTWFRSYGPYTGIKRDLYEGGIRVPTIARWPGHIAPGRVSAAPVGNWDWLATFAELAGAAVPAYTDGESLLPILTTEGAELSRPYLYWEYFHPGSTPDYSDFSPPARDRRRGEMQSVRIGNFKGVRFDVQEGDAPFEIYDLATDTTESTNLAPRKPALEGLMRAISLRGRMAEPTAERPYDTVAVPALPPPPALQSGVNRRDFDTSGYWIPQRPDYGPALSTTGLGPAADTEAGLPPGRGYEWTAYLHVPQDGPYTFELAASGAAYVRLHDIHLLHQSPAAAHGRDTARVHLAAGLHPITVRYTAPAAGSPLLELRWTVPGGTSVPIPAAALYRTPGLIDSRHFR